jgi:transposase
MLSWCFVESFFRNDKCEDSIIMRYVNGVDRNQTVMFPECLDDYIENVSIVRFLDEYVDSLDLLALGFKNSVLKETGRPPYQPCDLLKLYIYGYFNRIRSSRCLEREACRNIELIWLLRKLVPDHKTIANFRKDNVRVLKSIFKDFVFFCKELDLIGGELVSIDGSKFQAVNSKERNYSEKKLKRKIDNIDKKIDEYLKAMDDNDDNEPNEKKMTKEELQEKIKAVRERKARYEAYRDSLKESGETQLSLTDPDSRLMMDNHRNDVCYNVQTVVDEKNKLILNFEVTNEVNDLNMLSKMATSVKDITGLGNLDALADKGYYSALEIKACVDEGITPLVPEPVFKIASHSGIPQPGFLKEDFIYEAANDVYVCPAGKMLTYDRNHIRNEKKDKVYKCKCCSGCSFYAKCTTSKKGRVIHRWEYENIIEKMRSQVIQRPDLMKKRKELSEHPFGTLKRGFGQGYMLLKGLVKTNGEMALSMLIYNFLALIFYQKRTFTKFRCI